MLNGFEYPYYLNEDGTRSTVPVYFDGLVYLPEVVDPLLVLSDGNSGHYTYPENLLHVADFLGFWESTWAKSLVTYHPEYCYYESCREYNIRQSPADYLTSDQFDELLTSTTTMADAYEFELLTSTYQPTNWSLPDPADLWPFSTDENDKPYDPFIVRGNAAGEIFSGSTAPYFGQQLFDKISDIDGNGTSIQELAAYSVVSAVDPTNPLLNNAANWASLFGANVGTPSEYEANKNQMWIAYTALYLGAKRDLQNQRDNMYAIEYCAGYNGCFGSDDLGEYEVEFVASSGSGVYDDQPCNPETASLYANMVPRFSLNENDLPETNITDQCANEANLQNLFNVILSEGELAVSMLSLSQFSQWSDVFANPDIYNPAYNANMIWNATTNSQTGDLEIDWLMPSMQLDCEINLDNGTAITDWTALYYIVNLQFGAGNNFSFTAWYYDAENNLQSAVIHGTSDCLEPCTTANTATPCQPNQLAQDLIPLMNELIAHSEFRVNGVALTPSYYSNLLTPSIMAEFPGTTIAQMKWDGYGAILRLYSTVNPNLEIVMHFAGMSINMLDAVDEVVSLNCRAPYMGQLTTSIQALDGNSPITIYSSDYGASTRDWFCNCIEIPSPCCQGPGYLEFEHVKSLMEELVSNATDNSTGAPFANPGMYSYILADHVPTTTGYYSYSLSNSTFNGQAAEKIWYNGSSCDLVLFMYPDANPNVFNMLDFGSIIAQNFHVEGEPDGAGNYYAFSFQYQGRQFYGSWCVPMKQCSSVPPCGSIPPLPPLPPFTPEDPCVDFLEEIATNNAQYAYEQWYESFTGDLAEAYTNHCLENAVENLTVKFDDMEYHYTLYYYDQAGNLVRTVPPAGVDPLPINSSFDPIAANIDEDRATGIRRIYTFHNMPTTYTYNSLNQLVRQSLPDHDKMVIWETKLPNGVATDFIANEIQLVNPANGFMGGEVEATGYTNNRGYLYKSIDGGQGWQRMDGLVAADLKKVEMVNATLGYAIGNDGVFLKTNDGGANWTMLVNYDKFGNTLIPRDFTDFAINLTQGGTPVWTQTGALLVGKDGLMMKMTYTNALVEQFTLMGNTLITSTESTSIIPPLGVDWDIQSVEFGGFRFFLWVNFTGGHENNGFSLPVSCNAGIGWYNATNYVLNVEELIRPSDLSAVHQYDLQKAYAAGADGRVYHCNNLFENASNYAQWYQVPTNIRHTFTKLHFYNHQHGLSLVNEGVGGSAGAIYKTHDHGQTWTKVSVGNAVYNDLYEYHRNPTCNGSPVFTGARYLAVGAGGIVSRLTLVISSDEPAVGIETILSPVTTALNACWAETVIPCTLGSNYMVRYFVAGNGGIIYTALVGGYDNTPEWQTLVSNTTNNITDIEINAGASTNGYPLYNGVLLDHTGALHTLYIAVGAPDCNGADAACNSDDDFCPNHCPADYVIAPITGLPLPTPLFTHITRNQGTTSEDNFAYGLVQTQPGAGLWAYDAFRFDLTGVVVPPIDLDVTDPSVNDEYAFTSWSARSENGSVRINMVGGNGFNWSLKVTNNTTSTNWINDDRYAVRPLHNLDVEYAHYSTTNNVKNAKAVGKNGGFFVRRVTNAATGYICWNQHKTGITDDITAIDYGYNNGSNTQTYGYIGTAGGQIRYWTCTNNTAAAPFHPGTTEKQITSVITANLYDNTKRVNAIACHNVGGYNVLYVAGDDGLLLYSPSMITVNFQELQGGDLNYYGLGLKMNSTQAILCGENSRMERCIASTNEVIKNVFTPGIIDVQFIDGGEGYVLAKGFTIRHTTNGGATWEVVLPAAPLGAILPTLKKLAMKENGWAYMVGNTSTTAPYISKITGNTSVIQSTTGITASSIALNDIQFDASGTPWIVGKVSSKGALFTRPNDTGNWSQFVNTTAPNTEYNAFHIFPSNNSIMACGTTGKVNLWFNGLWADYNVYTPAGYSTINFQDIFFHDDLVGYLVGTGGTVLKTDYDALPLPDYDENGSGLLFPIGWALPPGSTSIGWQSMGTGAVYNGQSTAANITINTIAFSNRWEGIWGGSYNGSPRGHVRLIRDESEIFSTRFYYDRLGRIVASQNTKQFNGATKRYSYTLYDELGRVYEAGEKTENSSGQLFAGIFGVWLEGYYTTKTIDDTRLNNWIAGNGSRKEVTRTYYDDIPVITTTLPADFVQDNLRKRVACVAYEDVYDGNITTYQHATHYTYDIHGNVNTLIQDNPAMGVIEADERHKRLDYEYDLISGNVKQVSYQAGKADQYYHRYLYDADNRITDVYTSRQGWESGSDVLLNTNMPGEIMSFFEHDAIYRYYLHGPLARVEIGDIKVQGADYAYTLQGWLKGVNSNTLLPERDMGHDGMGVNKYFGYDAFGFTLGYYRGDYEPIDPSTYWTDPATRFEASIDNPSSLGDARNDLFNGNIGHMVTALYAPVGSTGGATTGANMIQGMAYRYDQLNRLIYAQGYDNLNVANNEWEQDPLYAFKYGNAFTYDANGNILTQRKEDGAAGGDQFENLTYQYHLDGEGMPVKNRLYHVNETIAANIKPDDIDDQGDFYGDAPGDDADQINGNNNYIYDEIGQLITDESEGIQTITWRVDAKIKYVSRDQSLFPTRKELGFDYDAMGNRIAKHVYDATGAWEKTTYYVRDASGNVMSTYEHTIQSNQSHITQTELHIYGSSRIGMVQPNKEMIAAPAVSDVGHLEMIRGIKVYELSNHLGNVLSVVTDQKLIIEDNSPGTVHHYLAEVISYTDYYPFGSPMAERTWEGDYRYGFNGKERDDDMAVEGGSYDFGARMYDGRLGRWSSLDPKLRLYPNQSNYTFAGSNPVFYVDHMGETITPFNQEIDKKNIEADWDKLFTKKNGKNLMAAVLKNSFDAKKGCYTSVSQKEFKKALRGLSADQKAIARGYYQTINDQSNVTVRGVSNKEQIAFSELEKTIPISSKMKTGIINFGKLEPGATSFSLEQLGTPAITIMDRRIKNGSDQDALVLYSLDVEKSTVDAVSIKDPVDENGLYKTLKESYATMVEARVHEIIGHFGFDSGAIPNKGVSSQVTAIQVSNIVRRIESGYTGKKGQYYEPRTGQDHDLGTASKKDVVEIPTGLQEGKK